MEAIWSVIGLKILLFDVGYSGNRGNQILGLLNKIIDNAFKFLQLHIDILEESTQQPAPVAMNNNTNANMGGGKSKNKKKLKKCRKCKNIKNTTNKSRYYVCCKCK